MPIDTDTYKELLSCTLAKAPGMIAMLRREQSYRQEENQDNQRADTERAASTRYYWVERARLGQNNDVSMLKQSHWERDHLNDRLVQMERTDRSDLESRRGRKRALKLLLSCIQSTRYRKMIRIPAGE
jgi:hypothetical protein